MSALERKIRSQKWTSDYREGVAELKRLSELPASTGSGARIEKLLDAAFSQLAWDSDEHDPGTIAQRKSLKVRFEKILRVRQNAEVSHER